MSPRTQKQFQEIREEKKSLIMDVALLHFAREGFYRTTISHIARHAGISKGLMYNYFKSKEELLAEIVNRSMSGIESYLDPDRDGYLSEDEFELFVKKLFLILREKITFWQLFYQLLMQNEVRSQIMAPGHGDNRFLWQAFTKSNTFFSRMIELITEYFQRKKGRSADNYDAEVEMNMFICTIEGFAMITVYSGEVDDDQYEKTINRIIELYR